MSSVPPVRPQSPSYPPPRAALGAGGRRVAGGMGWGACLSPRRARLGGFSHQGWGALDLWTGVPSRNLRPVWFKPSRLSWGDLAPEGQGTRQGACGHSAMELKISPKPPSGVAGCVLPLPPPSPWATQTPHPGHRWTLRPLIREAGSAASGPGGTGGPDSLSRVQVIAPWRMPEFYNRFQGRNDLMEYAKVRPDSAITWPSSTAPARHIPAEARSRGWYPRLGTER